jgi:integrase/recombinase XerD
MPIKTTLTSDEITQMIALAPTLRDKVIISFMADTGCRVSEMLSVKLDDIDFGKGIVLIPHLKVGLRKKCPKCGKSTGRRQKFCPQCGIDISNIEAEGTEERTRLINIGEDTLKLCQEYLAQRENKSDHLVPLTRQMVYYILRQAAENIGLKGKVILNPETGKKHYVHPHSMRDSLAVDWLTYDDSAEGQKTLQQHLGHKRFETTARYFKLTLSQVQKMSDDVRRHRFGKG